MCFSTHYRASSNKKRIRKSFLAEMGFGYESQEYAFINIGPSKMLDILNIESDLSGNWKCLLNKLD